MLSKAWWARSASLLAPCCLRIRIYLAKTPRWLRLHIYHKLPTSSLHITHSPSRLDHHHTTAMPRVAARAAERALPLLIRRPLRPVHSHICRSCLTRQFGTTLSRSANIPWYKRAKEFFFGSKESKQAEQKREEAEQAREEASASGDQPVVEEPAVPRPRPTALEVIPGRNGRQFQVAAVVKQELDMDYVPADNWAGLERIGSRQWQREKADHGEKYTGCVSGSTGRMGSSQALTRLAA